MGPETEYAQLGVTEEMIAKYVRVLKPLLTLEERKLYETRKRRKREVNENGI